MSIPNGTYSPPKIFMNMSELREYLDSGKLSKGGTHSQCPRCHSIVKYFGKFCVRENGVECVATNEHRCQCGYVMTPGELMRNIV